MGWLNGMINADGNYRILNELLLGTAPISPTFLTSNVNSRQILTPDRRRRE